MLLRCNMTHMSTVIEWENKQRAAPIGERPHEPANPDRGFSVNSPSEERVGAKAFPVATACKMKSASSLSLCVPANLKEFWPC